MIYSIHTMALDVNPDTNKFQKLRHRAYGNSESSHRMYNKKGSDTVIDTALADKGIKIEYHDGIYKKKIRLIINPTTILGGNDIKKLWKPTKDNISKLLKRLKKYINDYFDSKYKLKDFTLTRIDFTVNIDVGSNENVAAYIRVLHNIGKVKGFAPKYDDNDIGIDKTLSFDLEGNSNGIDFTVYDKEGASNRKEARGILRVEVRLMKQKTIRKHTNTTDISKQIKDLALSSRSIFLSTFLHIVPHGDYFKKKDVVEVINKNIVKKVPKKKMLTLLDLIPKKKSLYLAQKEMNDRNIDKVMKMFAELGVSPVTISKRHNIKHLKSLYSFLYEN